MAEPIILCENLVKIYKIQDVEVLALQGLELTVQRGELMGIVGASGSGKSTLMNVLGGLVRPSAGTAIVDGHDLLKLSDAQINKYRREKVGFVWQQGARNLIPYLNALENVEMPMTLAGVHGRRTRQHAQELLEMVQLSHRRHHKLGQMSGGEQQRVAIAVALANNPRILLADEPTGELDSATALTIYEAFQTLNRELGLTILIVSHDPTIARHVQRVMQIRDGKAASETVRRRRQPDTPTEQHEDHFEELVVLDSVGRLQLPKQYREALNLHGRARMELVDDHLIVRPVPPEDLHQLPPELLHQAEAAEEKGDGRMRQWLYKIRNPKQATE
jgi:ABC-type lipoprotein export system ATPase subunit/bifunctional DNA-binding transcriptional regulator/antitoxin component of YhaV-PrlF toxin-antitoxin module